MRKWIIFPVFFILVLIFSCARVAEVSFAKGGETKTFATLEGSHFKPLVSPDSRYLILSDLGNNRISLYDIARDSLAILATVRDAGHYLGFTPDSKYVYYVSPSVRDKGMSYDFILYDPKTEARKFITRSAVELRVLSGTNGVNGDRIVYLEDGYLKEYDYTENLSYNADKSTVGAYSNSDLKLAIYRDGEILISSPAGKGNYIWVSTSPDLQRVLFTVSGKGTYSCDLNGRELISYGKVNAPKWSADGRYIYGMEDEDDGIKFTESKIIMVSSDGSGKQILEVKKELIPLYPNISPDGSQLFFNDENGKVYMMRLL